MTSMETVKFEFLSDEWVRIFNAEMHETYELARRFRQADGPDWSTSLIVVARIEDANGAVHVRPAAFARDGQLRFLSVDAPTPTGAAEVSISWNTFVSWAGTSMFELVDSGRLYMEPTVHDPFARIMAFNMENISHLVVPTGPFPAWLTFTA